VIWGKPCWEKNNQERYLNLRAQASHQAALAAKQGRLSVLTGDHKRAMIAQASGIPKAHTGNYRIKVPEKGAPEWEGRGSPDLWDPICFAFMEGVQYVPVGGGALSVSEDDDDPLSKLAALAAQEFGDLVEEVTEDE
jgi:hypothetical protein